MNKEVLAAASFYKQKYFFNVDFKELPKDIQTEIQILSVCTAEKIRGVFIMGFRDSGIYLESQREENDFGYDEINATSIINEILTEKEELIKALQIWYAVFASGGLQK